MLQVFFAYLDAGSGSVILQAIIGGTAAVAIMGKLWWRRILSLLRIRKGGDKQVKDPDAEAS